MSLKQAAKNLLAARDAHLEALAAQYRAEKEFHKAESSYIAELFKGDNAPETLNIVAGNHLIMTCEDSYDSKPGERVTFYKVGVLS